MGMGRTVLLLMSVALSVVLLSGGSSTTFVEAQAITAKPNLVFILADDMRKDDMKYMPKTRTRLGAAGMQFENAFVSYGICCPSRATILTGQYAHNHRVWTNGDKVSPTDGGWE